MKMSDLDFQFEIKGIDEDSGMFKGRASVFNILDSYMDKVKRGAFAESLRERGSKGIRMLWHHNRAQPIGVWTSIKETTKALEVEGSLALGVQMGREAYELLKMGAVDGLSIGFSTRKSQIDEETGIRTLMDIDLREVSLVTFPALEPARITDIKEIMPLQDLPIAPWGTEWSPSGAYQRVMGHKDRSRAFVWNDGEERKFLICDVINDKLCVVPQAVFAAAALAQGACRTSVMDEPDLTGVRERLDDYYLKLRAKFGDDSTSKACHPPWRSANPFAATLASAASLVETERDFEAFLRDAGWSRKEAEAIVARGFRATSGQGEPVNGLQKFVDRVHSATRTIQP